jgi:hypothetical protein
MGIIKIWSLTWGRGCGDKNLRQRILYIIGILLGLYLYNKGFTILEMMFGLNYPGAVMPH